VKIDNVNTTLIPISLLRDKITVISQTPDLFSGTVRFNLDPYGKFQDEELVSVLWNVSGELGKAGLDNKEVSVQGSNLSIGERQLLCFARSVLRKNRIVILDEASANLDDESDACLQGLVSEYLQDCTVLTIAHRLSNVMQSDRIMVLDAGRIVEFDSPQRLLNNENSGFH
jgi:ABC-type multidrug transport system fused ATPase/permease subunit